MDFKQIAITVLIVMAGIYAVKWFVKNVYPIPVVSQIAEGV